MSSSTGIMDMPKTVTAAFSHSVNSISRVPFSVNFIYTDDFHNFLVAPPSGISIIYMGQTCKPRHNSLEDLYIMKKVLGCIRKACEEFRLIEDGDKIGIGVSGGKDSLMLLYAMSLYRKFSKQKFEIVALTLTMGIEPFDVSPIAALCEKLDVEYIVRKTEIGKVIFEERKEKNPCSLCAKMRRGALNELAKEVGCNKVALGHHRDDALETLMLCLLHEGRIHTFHPSSYLSRMDLTVIRPMVYVPEKHIIHLTKVLELPVVKSPCPANGNTQREEMKTLLDSLCRLYPNARELMLSALRNEEQYGLWDKPKD